MFIASEILENVRKLKRDEVFLSVTPGKKASTSVALLYPSPYKIAMSSLGYQTIYRLFNRMEDVVCERAFLPEEPDLYRKKKTRLFTFESETEVKSFDILAFSVAYEIELLGVVETLELANLAPLAADRNEKYDPIVIAGGPLTFSNPLPLAPFTDVILMGEAEGLIHTFIEMFNQTRDRKTLLKQLSELPGFYVPSIHGDFLPAIAKAPEEMCPAYSEIITPHTELSNMFLIEPERGCSRGCTFCVMRRSTNNGMRLVGPDKFLSLVPENIRKVGLVGAAVSDHPKMVNILEELVLERGLQVGLSSLRADRLTPRFVELLKLGGYRTLTVASDGASERLRNDLQKRIYEKHLLQSAEYAREYKINTFKIYMMIGVPGETDEDLDELVDFCKRLAKVTKTAMGIAPFVSKKNTPLDRFQFEGIKSVEHKLKKLQKELGRHIDLRSTSARWAWVEYKLAQGTTQTGYAVLEAYRNGGTFSAWKQALEAQDDLVKAV